MSSLNSFFNSLGRQSSNAINCTMLGKVKRIDNAKRVADIEPLHAFKDVNGAYQRLPLLINVPIALFGNDDFVVNVPIKENDLMIVLFADYDIDNILIDGRYNEPDSDRVHHLKDSIALPLTIVTDNVTGVQDVSSAYISNRANTTYVKIDSNGNVNIRSDADVNIDCEHYNVTERGV